MVGSAAACAAEESTKISEIAASSWNDVFVAEAIR
jgi:hypothetical protein